MRLLVAMLCVLGGCAFSSGSRRGPTERQTITVKDESGKPLPGADVYAIESWVESRMGKGSSPQRVHGPLRTNSQGNARVEIGNRSRVFYVATYPGWPSQTGTLQSPNVIVLG